VRSENSPSKLANALTFRVRANFDPISILAASRAARAPSTVNSVPGSAMKEAVAWRVGLSSCTQDSLV